jgi:hypothetical protein
MGDLAKQLVESLLGLRTILESTFPLLFTSGRCAWFARKAN